MAFIDIFKIANNAKELQVTATAPQGSNFTQVLLWTEDTYKDYTQALDFTSKLDGTSTTETFTIEASELSESTLDGIYFIEMVDNSTPSSSCAGCSNTVLGVATDFSRFNNCIVEYLCKVDIECNNEYLHKAVTMKMYIDGLRNSLQLGNFTTAIQFWKNLNRSCEDVCKTCSNTLSELAKKGLGFQTLAGELILV